MFIMGFLQILHEVPSFKLKHTSSDLNPQLNILEAEYANTIKHL